MPETTDEPLVQTILEAIAARRGVDVSALDFVLQDAVDADALNALGRHDGSVWSLSLTIDGHSVTVDSDGLVLVDGEAPKRE